MLRRYAATSALLVFYLLMAVFGICDVNLDKLKMLQVRWQ
jgi:hypothetical protein